MKWIFSFSVFLLSGSLFSQAVVSSLGGDYSSQTGNIAFSLGQLSYQSMGSDEVGEISEGVQHPIEVYAPLSTGLTLLEEQVSVYPNPFHNALMVDFAEAVHVEYGYSLRDMTGRDVLSGNLNQTLTQLDLSFLPPGAYTLLLSSVNTHSLSTFKIIKQ